MSTENQQAFRRMANMYLAISILLLLTHLYYYYYAAFEQWHLTCMFTNHILKHIVATGLFWSPHMSKLLAYIFLVLSFYGVRRYNTDKVSLSKGYILANIGVLLFFLSTVLLQVHIYPNDPVSALFIYGVFTVAGYLLTMAGVGRISRAHLSMFRRHDPFGRELGGFPQEERLCHEEFSLHLKASYTYRMKTRPSWINLLNPRRGILIIGNSGSGKTWLILEPLIRQIMEKGLCMMVFDFKYDDLSRLTYHYYQKYRDKYPPATRFHSINFVDLSRSNRCNVIEPSTLSWLSDALGVSRTTLLSLNKSWVNRQGEFFVESPINFFGALIWFLRKYRDGLFCTLPHAIELSQVPYEKLFFVLLCECEIETLVQPFSQAYLDGNMELLNSQVTSAKIPLARLASPDLYYILSGNDHSLEINDPGAPAILCLGGDPVRQEALAPVLSLYIDRLNKLINRKDRYPCAVVCEEFATVRAPGVLTTLAVARSNNIIPIIVLQDLSQARLQYSRDEAELLLNLPGNLLCGQTNGETARLVSDRFPKILQEKTSVSTNSSDTSTTQSRQWEPSVTQATISALSSGEFVGIVADNPGQEQSYKTFHARVDKEQGIKDRGSFRPLPIVNLVDETAVMENFLRIKKDIRELVEDIMRGK